MRNMLHYTVTMSMVLQNRHNLFAEIRDGDVVVDRNFVTVAERVLNTSTVPIMDDLPSRDYCRDTAVSTDSSTKLVVFRLLGTCIVD
jgi:hypothetical protein